MRKIIIAGLFVMLMFTTAFNAIAELADPIEGTPIIVSGGTECYNTSDGTVWGYVKWAESGEPCKNKTVKITDGLLVWWLDYTRSTKTDEFGYYEFTDVPCNYTSPITGRQAEFYVFHEQIFPKHGEYYGSVNPFYMPKEGMKIKKSFEVWWTPYSIPDVYGSETTSSQSSASQTGSTTAVSFS